MVLKRTVWQPVRLVFMSVVKLPLGYSSVRNGVDVAVGVMKNSARKPGLPRELEQPASMSGYTRKICAPRLCQGRIMVY